MEDLSKFFPANILVAKVVFGVGAKDGMEQSIIAAIVLIQLVEVRLGESFNAG